MQPPQNRTLEVFQKTAATYDRDRTRLIPGHEQFYSWALDLIPARAKQILELGCGSGMFSAMLRQRFPAAELNLIDFSEAMLSLARERLVHRDGITFHLTDYLTTDLPAANCTVVSSLSIHHLENEAKQLLFPRIWRALKPNGVFVNADQVSGPTAELEARYKSWWLEKVRESGATEQQVEDSLYRQREDRCATVEDQLQWMRVAGFADADCWFKHGRFAVLSGTRR